MGKRILIYDDDEDILEICRYIFEAMGLEVSLKKSCVDVREDLEQINPDIVLMDNWIPEIGGIAATRAIKSDPKFDNIPVVLFTAGRDIEKHAKEAGADAFIEKPFDLKGMEDVIKRFLK